MLKVSNLVSEDAAKYLRKSNFDKIYYDIVNEFSKSAKIVKACLLYTSPSPRDS